MVKSNLSSLSRSAATTSPMFVARFFAAGASLPKKGVGTAVGVNKLLTISPAKLSLARPISASLLFSVSPNSSLKKGFNCSILSL